MGTELEVPRFLTVTKDPQAPFIFFIFLITKFSVLLERNRKILAKILRNTWYFASQGLTLWSYYIEQVENTFK